MEPRDNFEKEEDQSQPVTKEEIEYMRKEHEQITNRILNFIEPKIKDMSGSMAIRVSHAALLSTMTVWTVTLETYITKSTGAGSAAGGSSSIIVVNEFVNDCISRASAMAENSINKLVDSLSPAQAAATMSTVYFIFWHCTCNRELKSKSSLSFDSI
jgi:hypothetical protein